MVRILTCMHHHSLINYKVFQMTLTHILFILVLLTLALCIILPRARSSKKIIRTFLESGKCPDCGSSLEPDTHLSISNQSYHDSKQDILCTFFCTCELSGKNIFTHLLHDKPEHRYLYNLAVKYKNKQLPWQSFT